MSLYKEVEELYDLFAYSFSGIKKKGVAENSNMEDFFTSFIRILKKYK